LVYSPIIALTKVSVLPVSLEFLIYKAMTALFVVKGRYGFIAIIDNVTIRDDVRSDILSSLVVNALLLLLYFFWHLNLLA
jgi:hypothetical protein